MQGIRIPLILVNWLDLKYVNGKNGVAAWHQNFLPSPLFFLKTFKISFYYYRIAWCELDSIKLPVYKIDLNSYAFLLSQCLS